MIVELIPFFKNRVNHQPLLILFCSFTFRGFANVNIDALVAVTHLEPDLYIRGNILYSSKYTNGVYNLGCSLITVDKDFLHHECVHFEAILTSVEYWNTDFSQVNSTVVALVTSSSHYYYDRYVTILSRETKMVLHTVIFDSPSSVAVFDTVGAPSSILVAEVSQKLIAKIDSGSYNVSTVKSLPVSPLKLAVRKFGNSNYIYFTFAGGLARYDPNSGQAPNNVEYLISGSTFGYRDGLTTQALLSENPSAMYFLSDRVLLIADENLLTSTYYYETRYCETRSYNDCHRTRHSAVQSIIRIWTTIWYQLCISMPVQLVATDMDARNTLRSMEELLRFSICLVTDKLFVLLTTLLSAMCRCTSSLKMTVSVQSLCDIYLIDMPLS